MSAVENVDARIVRMQQSLDAKCAELRTLQTHQRYNINLGVDEDIATGRSVAILEIKVGGARNLLFSSGFLAGRTAYVRAWLEPRGATANTEAPLCTRKIGIESAPRWNESLFFQGVAHVGAVLMVEVLQEERIGKDQVVGALQLPLALLQNQRPMEKWHALAIESSELQLSCRFSRSRISALELEVELLQNQLRELHSFVARQRQVSPQAFAASDHFVPRNPLKGKEVTLQSSFQRTGSSRFNAVATFPTPPPPQLQQHVPAAAARKREHFEFARTSSASDVAAEVHRAKRQRVVATAPAPAPVSFTDKLANWLLPSSPAAPTTTASSTSAVMTAPLGLTAPASTFPFKQQPAPDKRRVKKPAGGRPARQKSSSVLQSFEQWLFTDPENTAPN